jgi:hypothetical protein
MADLLGALQALPGRQAYHLDGIAKYRQRLRCRSTLSPTISNTR